MSEAAASCAAPAVSAAFATFFTLLVVQAILYIIYRLYWSAKSGQHLVLVTDTEKGDLYAYDNPGFKEGPSIVPVPEKEPSKVKWPQWATIGLNATGGGPKVKAMDDTFTTQPVLTVVPLRSHDFTGLGFNICGNMRDGIFVKDVLHRGPASESGSILPGDRIESVKVSLRHMVLEDALTILSYASPYEVELGVESRLGSRTAAPAPLAAPTLRHPFYKSHSISDLHQIEKSNSKRSVEKQSSCGDGVKISTLEKKAKLEAEKYQNSKNCIIESFQKNEAGLHSMDIDEPDRRSASPSSMKTMLVKGIQNLRDKLHGSPQEKDDGWRSAELRVVETPEERVESTVECIVERAEDSIVETLEERVESPEGRRGKRRAPHPPQEDTSPPTVSAPVTVHQADSEARKAASLGDLSRCTNNTTLERAASLDLDGAARKRKAPLPPPESSSPTQAQPPSSLKKADVWGTLEDALHTSDSEIDLGISGCSTPEKHDYKSPFELSTLSNATDPLSIMVSACSWDLSMLGSDEPAVLNGDDTPPELPTSPIPKLDSFVTEIEILTPNDSPSPTSTLSHDLSVHETKFSLVEIDTNESPKEVTKPPRSNVSLTSIKSGTSRIPVRAGQRSPSSVKHSPELRRLPTRNGHHTP